MAHCNPLRTHLRVVSLMDLCIEGPRNGPRIVPVPSNCTKGLWETENESGDSWGIPCFPSEDPSTHPHFDTRTTGYSLTLAAVVLGPEGRTVLEWGDGGSGERGCLGPKKLCTKNGRENVVSCKI